MKFDPEQLVGRDTARVAGKGSDLKAKDPVDEPFASLDTQTRLSMRELLMNIPNSSLPA